MTSTLVILGSYLPVFFGCTAPFTAPKFLAIALGCFFGTWRSQPESKPLRFGFLAVITAVTVSALLSDSPLLTFWSRANSTSQGLPGVLLIWLCYEAARHGDRDRAGEWLELGAVLSALAAVLQAAGLTPLLNGLSRSYGLTGSPPFLGCMVALAVPALTTKKRWLSLAILGAAVWFSQSRAGMVGVIAGLVTSYCPIRLIGPIIVAGAFAVLPLATRSQGDTLRFQMWYVAWQTFLGHPFFGCGLEGFTDAMTLLRTPTWANQSINVVESAHNVVISALAYGGVVGVASLAYLGRLMWKQNPPRGLWAATAAVLAYGMFNPVPFTAWCVLAFLWGCEA